MTFLCSAASVADGEPMAGTAPTDVEWLFVEHPGPWGRDAPSDVGLSFQAVRVQLIRRHGGGASSSGGVRLFAATVGAAVSVRTAVVASLASVSSASWEPYDGPLLMVCTNGRRDRCCSEIGRPVTAALAARWPEATWETTHLGGHRFAGTLLALPSGIVLGRLTSSSAVPAVSSLLDGSLPLDLVRGRAGLPGEVQAAELAVRQARSLRGLADVTVTEFAGDEVVLDGPDGAVTAHVFTGRGEPRRQSCAEDRLKPVPTYSVSLPADM